MTKYYSGRYSLIYGQPYIIMSVEENENDFKNEVFIIFEGFDGKIITKAYRTTHPRVIHNNVNEFIEGEIRHIKDVIFYNIVWENYKDEIKRQMPNLTIELQDCSDGILGLLRNKFKSLMERISTETNNKELENRIKLYLSIVIERNDFEI